MMWLYTAVKWYALARGVWLGLTTPPPPVAFDVHWTQPPAWLTVWAEHWPPGAFDGGVTVEVVGPDGSTLELLDLPLTKLKPTQQ